VKPRIGQLGSGFTKNTCMPGAGKAVPQYNAIFRRFFGTVMSPEKPLSQMIHEIDVGFHAFPFPFQIAMVSPGKGTSTENPCSSKYLPNDRDCSVNHGDFSNIQIRSFQKLEHFRPVCMGAESSHLDHMGL
jgi:hypothetical protein